MGNTCCSNQNVDFESEVAGMSNTLRPCQSQMIGDVHYRSMQIVQIVKLQRRVRKFLERRRAVKEYLQICPPELSDLDTDNVKTLLRRFGPFVYMDKAKEADFGFEKLEKRPMNRLNNGSSYVGEWRVDTTIREGRGRQVWPDGSLYEGYWQSNKANLFGRLLHKDGDIYQGEWLDDKAHGFGYYFHQDGSLYRGFWENDTQDGKGVERWPDGSKFEGNYKTGVKQGKGTFTWADGNCYEGNFEANNIQGQGVYKWSDGRCYQGEWKDNKMHGYGVLQWPDGKRYEGEYVEDKKHGQGAFFWPNGHQYVGSWANGKQHGEGTLTKSGDTKKYLWENGKRIQEITTGGADASTYTKA